MNKYRIIATFPRQQREPNLMKELEEIMNNRAGKALRDFRDRAAFMYTTGSYPSHLRVFNTRALCQSSRLHNAPCSLDGRSGALKMDESIVRQLGLEDHPMVLKTREFIRDGWRIRVSRGPNARRPYTKVFLFKGGTKHTVQIDGSVLDHW